VNLHSIVAPYVGAVNPFQPIGLQVSVGSATNADFTRTPGFATPGVFTGSIGGIFTASIPVTAPTTLVVTAVIAGSLQPGDEVSGTDGVNALPDDTFVVSQLSGVPNGVGSYQISQPATLNAATVTAASEILNVTAVAGGVLQPGQTISGAGIASGTMITGGGGGGIGTYAITTQQTAATTTVSTFVTLQAQVQPLTFRDLQRLSGLNLSGETKAIYVNGPLNGVVRPKLKGGDVVTMRNGEVWLVTQILEAWNQSAGWTKAAITLQNDVIVGTQAPSNAQPAGAP
jgi:hypothetical protein